MYLNTACTCYLDVAVCTAGMPDRYLCVKCAAGYLVFQPGQSRISQFLFGVLASVFLLVGDELLGTHLINFARVCITSYGRQAIS